MAQDPRVLLREADKALSGASGGIGFFKNRGNEYEGAADLYKQAANAFRMQNQGKEAGLALERAASIFRDQLKLPDEAANILAEAFSAYKKSDPEDAVRCLNQAIQQWTLKGAFRRGAMHLAYCADLYENVLGDNKRALEAHETAAGWFENDNAEALANKHFLKVADLSALEGDYYKAIENYEKVAKSAINNNLMKYSVKDYLFQAGMCQLATGDMVGANSAMEKYRDMDNYFASAREHHLLVDCLEAIQQGDQDMFADKLFQFDQMSKLDKWKTTIFLRIKDGIQEQGDDFS